MRMKFTRQLLMLPLLFFTVIAASAQKLDRPAFYEAMKTGSKEDIDKEIAKLGDSEPGYTGALIVREAGLPGAKSRLKTFKQGKAKLEAAIDADPDNAELRFLRLSIQERSPKIVGYKSKLETDKAYLIKHFDKLPPIVQKAVKEYSKESKILKASDFN